MHTSQFKKCDNCCTLEELYKKVDCSIYQLMKNKWTGATYNVDAYFCADLYKTLLRYKRILYKRLYNATYPASCYTNEDLIAAVTKLLYRASDCPECKQDDVCDSCENCQCYSIIGGGGENSPVVRLQYKKCDGTPVDTYVIGPVMRICAIAKSVITEALVIAVGDCSSDCTSTTTTTTLVG